jgi:ribonucrease Y
MFDYLIIGWGVVLGLLVGGAMSRAISRRVLRQTHARAERIVEDAREAGRLGLRAAEADSREEALRLRGESEELERKTTEENVHLEERVGKLEGRTEKLEAELAVRQAELEQRELLLQKAKVDAAVLRQEGKDKKGSHRTVLEEKVGETAEQLRAQLVEGLVEEVRAQCGDRLRNLESGAAEEFARQAKRMMGISMGRYTGRIESERLTSTVALPEGGAERLRSAEQDHLHLIEESSGVRLTLSDTGESIRLEGGDGTARELARRSIARFVSEAKIRDPQRLAKAIAAELDREIREKGLEAFKLLDLPPAHPELVRLIGRLNYRTSYSQNQWEHTIEAACLAGLLAAELGLDPRIAKRGTLLHDIGKALTHELEGSHAVIGADLARRHGEEEIIANAVGAHHGDEPASSPYAHIVAAADAMSGARPGARREMVETYVERLADLENVASRFPGVVGVHAVQAGREVRVLVDELRVDDEKAARLSEEIAKRISDELTFPGQIRVTVIREFKAVELAS